MVSKFTVSALFCGVLAIAGCAQQEETMVYKPPVFNKNGDSGCEDGNGEIIYVPGSNYERLEPCDCEDVIAVTGQQIPCPPPIPGEERDDDPQRGGNNQAGGPIN